MSAPLDKEMCPLCGEFPKGFATINDQRYCHPDGPKPSCYMQASGAGAVAKPLDLLQALQDSIDKAKGHPATTRQDNCQAWVSDESQVVNAEMRGAVEEVNMERAHLSAWREGHNGRPR